MRIEELLFAAGAPLRVIDDDGEHGRAAMQEWAARVGRALTSSGLRIGDRVALVAENGAAFIAGLFGILAAGGTAVVVDPALPVGVIDRIVASSRAVARIDVGALNRSAPERLALRPGLSADQAAVVLYSSGTTGEPKGVVLSHRAILSNVRAIESYLKPSPRDLFYVARSMVHSATLVGEVLLAMSCGASLLALDPRVPATQMFRRIQEHRATIACVNPSLLRFFTGAGATAERLASLEVLHVSGAVVDREVFRRVHERFPRIRLINGYGLTEAGPRVAQLGTSEALKPGSVGKAIRGVSLAVRRSDGALCASREVGEIFVRTPSLMEGYLSRGGLTRPRLVGGELPTGDLGYLDEEGDLFVTGRKDDLIITGSHNVDPREIEEAVLQVRGVADCIVFGAEDPLLGQRVVCAYTVDAATPEDPARLNERLRETCSGALASYQVPKSFCRWSEIPLGPGGKKSRVLARRRLSMGGER